MVVEARSYSFQRRQDVVGDGDWHLRPLLGDDRRHAALVLRLDEGEQQADGDRLDLARGLQLPRTIRRSPTSSSGSSTTPSRSMRSSSS